MKEMNGKNRFFLLWVFALGAQIIFAQQKVSVSESKDLTENWKSYLYDRGEVTTYLKSRNELQYIGMPVAGIMTGGVYLGGDGRLWLWDIFNEMKEGVGAKAAYYLDGTVRSRDGANYIEPSVDIRPLEQGFTLRFEYNGKTIYKTLEEDDWDEIAFEATYPIGTVHYTDKNLPVELVLQAYSPFIPLNEEESGLPVTILSFSAKNTGSASMKVSLLGYLENKTSIRSADQATCRRQNDILTSSGLVGVSGSMIPVRSSVSSFSSAADYGTMFIGALNKNAQAFADVNVSSAKRSFASRKTNNTSKPIQEHLIGGVQMDLNLDPNASANADFLISWYFPNLKVSSQIKDSGRYYKNKFASASEVAQYVANNFGRLSSDSKLWLDTWKESTLPHWFLERTFLNVGTLATDNCYRFTSGRFWAWEGVGACAGTCTHVWQYAQAMGRLFPALERNCREVTDLNLAMKSNGGIIFRAEMESRPAIDGQAGTVLRCYREHQMSADGGFMKKNWQKIKLAVEFIISQDKNGDGMEDTPMENTLDAVWDGEIAWIVGHCIAAVKAGEVMAIEFGDKEFAKKCAEYVQKGSENMDKYLFNGEYYIHRPDATSGRSKLGSYNTCHIDQVLGQSWAHQVGLGRINDKEKTLSALRSLWKYNYLPDVGTYIETNKGGRPYALAGEAGMIMNTNPKNEPKPYGDNVTWQLGYFHECMSGFEYQVAAHMIAEGMVDQGMTLVAAIHDRYNAAKRNPFNEIECSDHYARAMASYGAFISACGFEYHGPKGYMKFAPKWDQDNFKAPFTAAEGWGSYAQQLTEEGMLATLQPKYGKVKLASFGLEAPEGVDYKSVKVSLDGVDVETQIEQNGQELRLTFKERITIAANQVLEMNVGITEADIADLPEDDSIKIEVRDRKIWVTGINKPVSVFGVNGQQFNPNRQLQTGTYLVEVDNLVRKILVH